MITPVTPRSLLSKSCLIILVGALSALPASANVRLPAIFGDHMVLQRDLNVPVWGWADPGECVTVTAGNDKATATAGADGKWSVKLNKLAPLDQPIQVTITGKNSITFKDVLIGDVWVCSGQSNMEFGARAFLPSAELAQQNHPQIRLFTVPKWVAPAPADDIAPIPANAPMLGKWQVCTPETVAKDGEWSGFSAVAFYFGRELQAFTQKPVGLIETCWGGTRIHSWISLKSLETAPEKVSAAKAAKNFQENYDQIKKTYETVTLPQWNATLEKWNQDNKAALDSFKEEMTKWQQAAKDAREQKQPVPPRPKGPARPRPPRDPIHDNQTSCALFNGMISPLLPYGIKGVIWYQGESNSLEPVVYRAEVPLLIKDWRNHWGQGDFPFLLVQLPNFGQPRTQPGESPWASTREAQCRALTLPNTGVAVTIDIGDAGNIHPADKVDVGRRLALVAQRVAYGQKLVAEGPTYKNFNVEGNKIRINFENTGGGLTIGNPPDTFFTANKKTPPTAAPTELKGFAIAGSDHKWVWADAKIDGNSVVVENSAVTAPVAVRYAWADNPACNLYNKEGLPAAPFRTDDFPYGK